MPGEGQLLLDFIELSFRLVFCVRNDKMPCFCLSVCVRGLVLPHLEGPRTLETRHTCGTCTFERIFQGLDLKNNITSAFLCGFMYTQRDSVKSQVLIFSVVPLFTCVSFLSFPNHPPPRALPPSSAGPGPAASTDDSRLSTRSADPGGGRSPAGLPDASRLQLQARLQ